MNRFAITYRLFASSIEDARSFAAAIALENTLEIPRDIVPSGYIEDVVLGRVEEVTSEAEGTWQARLSFHIDSVGAELPQLLNVIFGNASILPGVKVIKTEFNDDVRALFPGPKFGVQGVRSLIGRSQGGLLCAVIKPQGSSIDTLASLCYQCARAGADLIKEDHGLANQVAAPAHERIRACAQAVAQANAERAAEGDTTRALFVASLGGHGDGVSERAFYAKEQGADAVLIIPGLYGFDAIQRLARNAAFGLPIMAHPAFAGPYVLSPNTGYTHGVFFGDLMRLAGADISVFPNYGGRFGFSQKECTEIVNACHRKEGFGRSIMPSPGGGMSVDRIPEMMEVYGPDCVYLLGGSLLRLGDQIGEGIRATRLALDHAS